MQSSAKLWSIQNCYFENKSSFLYMHMYCIWNWWLSQVLSLVHHGTSYLYIQCTHMYESEVLNPVVWFLYRGMLNSNAYWRYSPTFSDPVCCPICWQSSPSVPSCFTYCFIVVTTNSRVKHYHHSNIHVRLYVLPIIMESWVWLNNLRDKLLRVW